MPPAVHAKVVFQDTRPIKKLEYLSDISIYALTSPYHPYQIKRTPRILKGTLEGWC